MINCNTLLNFQFNPSDYNILVIDDSKSVNNIVTKHFQSNDFNTFSAFTLTHGKEILQTQSIDYIMLDINLPDGNGYELIEQLQQQKEKIFVLTDEADQQFRAISYQKGIIDFISKDKSFFYKVEQLSKTIQQLELNKQKTILIVDDSFVVRKQLDDLLTNRNYNVEQAEDEKGALEILKQTHIDLILLDVELKNSNGIEFLQKNNEIITLRKIPVLIISGNIDASITRDALKAGAMDILKKPYITEEIVLKVDLWIDYKRKEDALICSNQLLEEYKSTVDENSIVSKADSKGIITFINDKFCETSGYTKEELIGKPHNIVRHPDTDKETTKELWHTIKNLKKSWHGKIKNRKKDGGYYWVKAHIKPILDVNGEIIEFIGLRDDITQEEEYKELLKNKLHNSSKSLEDNLNYVKQYEDAIDESSAIVKIDKELNITFVNNAYLKLTKYEKEEMIGKPIVDFIDELELQFLPQVVATINEGKIYQGIVKGRPKHGEPYYTKTTVKPIKNIDGDILEFLLIKNDITQQINLRYEIEDTQKEVVFKMGAIGETRSKETGLHVKRVAEYSYLLAKLCGLNEKDAEVLRLASPMHDIGKVGIPDNILNKPAKLTQEEFEHMKQHATLGYEMLKGSTRDILKTSAIVAHEHHEKWDGTGYPRGLKGEDIHIYGRITAIADVFDALGHDRCYKKSWELEKIHELFRDQKAKHFDPRLIDLFFAHQDKFLSIRDKYKDSF